MFTDILKMKSSWETLAESDLPIILYGTGNGADKVVDELHRLKIKLSGVMASDSFVRQRSFRGFTVRSLHDFESRYDDFIVAVAFGTQLDDVISNITDIAAKHRVIVPCAPVYGNSVFNRQFITGHLTELENTYDILYDEVSKDVFLDFLRFELTGELKYLFRSQTTADEAFYNILRLTKNEVYLDLGAYRGDTVSEFLLYCGNSYKHITAVEPDEKSFAKLSLYCSGKENVTLVNKGIWCTNGDIPFSSLGGRGSSVESGEKSTEAVTVDSLRSIAVPTYIKADIEGCEGQMLYGAFSTLSENKPKLNIAVYHRSEDIFAIPLKIKEINPNYKIHLRHHKYVPCWDMNIYCI